MDSREQAIRLGVLEQLIRDEIKDDGLAGRAIGLLREAVEVYRLDLAAGEDRAIRAEDRRLQDRRRLIRAWMANGECSWMILQAWEKLGDEAMGEIFQACPQLTPDEGVAA